MLTKLNERFIAWSGFDAYAERTERTAKILLAVGLIGFSIVYWAGAFQSQQNFNEMLFLAIVYAVVLAILAWVGAYLTWVIATILALFITPFIWLYRKICP